MFNELTTPAVVVDLDVVQRNIERIAARLKECKLSHRPHIKTHKSITLAKRQLAAGADGITVAKLSEAEVFAEAGFDDILIAYSIVGEDKLRRFAALHQRTSVLTTVDSEFTASGLSRMGEQTGKPVRVLIEIDGGLHRGGRQPGVDAAAFARSVHNMPGVQVVGVMGYFGQIYNETSQEGIANATRREAAIIRDTVNQIQQVGIPIEIVSAGSTPSATMGRFLEGVTEVRAGNYIFNDVSGVELGLATEADCALRVITTVISTPLPGRATIDAGSKTLTSDRAHHRDGYGIVVGYPGVTIAGLNEEHGMLTFDPSTTPLKVGDRLAVIPNHSCVIPNLNDNIYGVRSGKLVERIQVDARGCNY